MLADTVGLLPLLEVQGCLYLAAGVVAWLLIPRPVAIETQAREKTSESDQMA